MRMGTDQSLLCRCFNDGQFEQAVGIALEARRLDKLEEAIKKSSDPVALLTYSLNVCQTLVISRDFRQQVRSLTKSMYRVRNTLGYPWVLSFYVWVPMGNRNFLTATIFMQVLRLLVKLYKDSANPDWVSICQCLMFLGDSAEVAKILHQLLKGEDVSSVSIVSIRALREALLPASALFHEGRVLR